MQVRARFANPALVPYFVHWREDWKEAERLAQQEASRTDLERSEIERDKLLRRIEGIEVLHEERMLKLQKSHEETIARALDEQRVELVRQTPPSPCTHHSNYERLATFPRCALPPPHLATHLPISPPPHHTHLPTSPPRPLTSPPNHPHPSCSKVGGVEERMALLERQEKEARIAYVSERAMRRMANQGIMAAFTQWQEEFYVRQAQERMLRSVGVRMSKPRLVAVFNAWQVGSVNGR